MNKLSKIFLVIIIVLVLALCIMSYLYVNMRKSSQQNLDSLLTKSEELTNAYQRIDELEKSLYYWSIFWWLSGINASVGVFFRFNI